MRWKVHEEAVKEFLQLESEEREIVDQAIKSRKNRENSILDQRGTGIAYDNHGEPVHYFKVEDEALEDNLRIFFKISGQKIVLLGVRPRDDDTYLNLRLFA